MSLFVKAKPKAKRLKMYIYGESGTGKTVTSLQFPSPAVVDTQGGSEHYGGDFDFLRVGEHVVDPGDPDVVEAAIEELLEDPGDVKTFVVDSLTDVYDRMMQKRLRYQREKEGDLNYALGPSDWGFLKGEIKALVQKMLTLDMNVIATAEAAKEYSDTEFMKVVGTKPDGHKKVPYFFDVVLELTTDNEGTHWAEVHKDRTNSLPKKFEFTWDSFAKYMPIEGLERKAEANKAAVSELDKPDRVHVTEFQGKEVKTAGVSGETLEALKNISDVTGNDAVKQILKNDFFVSSPMDLKEDEAQLIINQLSKSK